jgi:hypothetical protein
MFVLVIFSATLAVVTSLVPKAPAAVASPHVRSAAKAMPARPAVVENGSDLVLYHFPNNVPEPVAFGPDGSAYSVVREGILKIAPNGVETFLPNGLAQSANEPIVYANGFLWFTVNFGLVRERPDGSDHRFYQYESNGGLPGVSGIQNLIAGSDGLYFEGVEGHYPSPETVVVGRIDALSKITLYNVPGYSVYGPPLVWSPDGHLDYIATAYGYHSITVSLEQIAPDGSSVALGTSNRCGLRFSSTSNLVSALGAIYYIGDIYDGDGNPVGKAICRATVTGHIMPITPVLNPSGAAYSLAADSSGDLWTTNFFGNGLYSYNILTKSVTGPYEPATLDNLGSFIYVGPDQNVWMFGTYATNQLFFGAYVRHQEVITPTSINLNSIDNASQEFIVTEPIKGGAPWTAYSLNPAVVTVTPASSLVGRFHANEVSAGTTSIVVTDALGNVSYVPVTAN